ncbi:MAG: right-handed parallel beta-helix repeat-containing protein [Actinomycetota bacterium]|nr:right-handed parallel beta-helix repeat-containing protein [Actinomycetota bacterium]
MSADDSVFPRISVTSATDNFCNIISSSYVGLYGFEVCGTETNANTNGSGISVYGNSHDVAIWQNSVHHFPGGGINCFDWQGSHDMVDISFNTIFRTSKFSPNNTSGISIYAGQDLTAGATFAGGFGYTIVGNYIYDVECQVPYAAGGYPFVTDGNGISLDKLLTQHGYSKQVLVADNVITGCGGRAVLAHETKNVLMTNNVAIGNLRTESPAINGGAELEGKTDGSVRIEHNVIFPINTATTVDGRSTFERNVFLSATTMDAGTAVPRSTTGADASVGFGYFAGPLSAAMLRSSVPRACFAPASG